MITLGRGQPRVGDRGLAVGFVVAAALEAFVRFHAEPVQLAICGSGSVTWAALYWRRRRPLVTISVIATMSILGSLLQEWLTPDGSADSVVAVVALLMASYSLGAYGSRRAVLLGAPIPVLLIVAIDLLQPTDEPLASSVLFAAIFVVLVPVVGGRLVRTRLQLIERLRRQAAELRAHRAEQAAADLEEERLRLTELFHARLLTGIRELAERIDRAVDAADSGEATMMRIEQAARSLLTQTRHAVVTLADDDAVPPDPPPDSSDRVRPAWDARPWTALAAAALGAGLIVELHSLAPRVPLPVAVLACVGLVLPLAVLWAAPLPLTITEWVLAAGFSAVVAPLGSSTAAIGLLFAVPFATAALTSRRAAIVGGMVCCVGAAGTLHSDLAGALIICVASWLVGSVLRDRAELAGQLQRNAALLAEQRAAIARRSVLDERARLARELHDAVGHSLTVVALQAGAVRRLGGTDPARAAEVLRTVAAVTRDGVRELAAGRAAATDAAAGLDAGSLDALVAGARLAGLTVEIDLEDNDAVWADSDTGSVLYRVVQESLTNVLKYAPEATVRVLLRRIGGQVELSVTNTAGQAPGSVGGSGHGLTGMRERVSSYGGRLAWGHQPDGGFRVRAQLPLAMADA